MYTGTDIFVDPVRVSTFEQETLFGILPCPVSTTDVFGTGLLRFCPIEGYGAVLEAPGISQLKGSFQHGIGGPQEQHTVFGSNVTDGHGLDVIKCHSLVVPSFWATVPAFGRVGDELPRRIG